MKRQADNFVNYQERATEFQVGDVVVPFGMFDSQAGRVTAVWPAIGMVDVEMPTGNARLPVEDLQRFDANGNAIPTHTESTPGGRGTVSVPGGPYPMRPNVGRVMDAHVKRALYWAEKDRKYRMNRSESDCGKPNCPRCDHGPLSRAVYKRRDGSSERLLGCKGCLFLIKDADIVNFGPVIEPEIEVEGED